jgi:hypothetical protein
VPATVRVITLPSHGAARRDAVLMPRWQRRPPAPRRWRAPTSRPLSGPVTPAGPGLCLRPVRGLGWLSASVPVGSRPVSLWEAVGALASLGAAGAATVGAFQSRASAREANAAARQSASAATALTAIERDRRRSELTPRFRVSCEPGIDDLTLHVMLLGPPDLHRLENLTVTIRPGEAGTRPYRFTPPKGPSSSPAAAGLSGATRLRLVMAGHEVSRAGPLPVGEGLTFRLKPNPIRRRRAEHGRTDRQEWRFIRLLLDAQIDDDWWWTLPCEIDTGEGPAAVRVPGE